MKSRTSIRSRALLAAALFLPLSVPAIRPHAPGFVVPRMPPAQTAQPARPIALNAEENASRLVDAIIQIESNGDARKVGRHGERGLMQLKAGTWRDMTTRLFGQPLPFDRAFDPALNRRVGTAYLAFLQESLLPRQAEWKSDERALLLAAYNVARAAALHDAFLDDMVAAVRAGLRAALRTAVAGG